MARFDTSQSGRLGAFGQQSISQIKDEKDLVRKVETLRRARQGLEREWKLNLAFFKGNQYVNYNRRSGQLDYLPTEDGEKPRFRVRLTANQIRPGALSLLAKLTKTKPVITATPGSGSIADVRAAQMAELLYEHWWQDLGMTEKLQEALLWSIIAGNGYWKITWDKHAGKSMKFTLDPFGQPILDEDLRNMFLEQLQQQGMQPIEQTLYLGDIKVEVMSPFDVLLDPSARVWTDAKYAFCQHALDPDEIFSRWGKRLKPDSIPADPDVTLPFQGAAGADNPTVKRVQIGYFVPQPGLPKGRYVVFSEDPMMILDDGPWPYPTNDLPLVKFPGQRVPGSVYDDGDVTDSRPLQKEMNRTLSQIVEYKNLTIRPRVTAPVGSLKQRISNEPGAVLEYQPIGGLKPELQNLPAMPPYVFEHLNNITSRLRDVFGLTEVTEGSVPPNVEAGVAIDLLQEMATDRYAPRIQQIETGLAQAGRLMISLAQKYYIEPRLMKIHGEGGRVQVKQFLRSDIDSNVDFHAEAGSGLPRTRAGRMARIEKLLEMGVMRPDQAWKYTDLADMKSVAARLAADEDQAEREHDKILRGEPLNPEEYQHAQMAVMSGMNPDTGQPLEGPQEAEQLLELALVRPGPVDNHAVHFDVHALEMKGQSYEGWPIDARRRMAMHTELHQQAMAQPPAPEPQAPRVSVQAKTTLDPDTFAKILTESGIQADPEELKQPPMETVVLDQIDKPDIEEAGNDPLTAFEVQQHEAEQAAHSSVAAAEAAHQGSQREQLKTIQEVHKTVASAAKARAAEAQARKAEAPRQPGGSS